MGQHRAPPVDPGRLLGGHGARECERRQRAKGDSPRLDECPRGPARTLVHLLERELAGDETLLLCSDGLHGSVADETLRDILASDQELPAMAQLLIAQPSNVAAVTTSRHWSCAAPVMTMAMATDNATRRSYRNESAAIRSSSVSAAAQWALSIARGMRQWAGRWRSRSWRPTRRRSRHPHAVPPRGGGGGRLSHPNIITIFDVGDDGDRLFIVMELLRGAILKDYLKQSDAPTLERKLDLMVQLCAGLGAAHNALVYHRDIKPGNIFVRTDGVLKILDFGVARLASFNMTAAGFIVGTPDYMSPEQAQGADIDGRSDIFSLGGVFYFMLTGRKPFAAGDLATLFHQIRHEDSQPLGNGTPPELAAVVMKALSKSREMRYQSCQDVIAELNTVRQQYALESRLVAVGGPETSGLAADAQHVAQVETATPPNSAGGSSTGDTVDSLPSRLSTATTPCRSGRHRGRDASGIESPRRFRVRSSVWAPGGADVDQALRDADEVDVPKLTVFRGDEVVKETSLSGAVVRIGREAGNDLVLEDSSKGVSRFHAEIRTRAGKYFVADLKSRNGVWIGGRRIKDQAELSLGLPVTIGSYELVLEDDTSSGAFEPVPHITQHTVVSEAANLKDAPGGSGTRPGPSRATTPVARRPVLWWTLGALAVLSVVAVAWVVVRNISRATPTPEVSVGLPAPPSPAPWSEPAPPGDPRAARIGESWPKRESRGLPATAAPRRSAGAGARPRPGERRGPGFETASRGGRATSRSGGGAESRVFRESVHRPLR